ncbi:class I SAM-dependent methyltransferase [Natribacillus halophilus]|uniref:Trans-aconitate methyltransferase n=1 Tax=Natribacillus halophilus TaxID=549003 RepID=A0A1G8PDQ4_9BACI|nr:methyltransferase domain-containing protein [Natribacillus halophilus]SDI90438.1 Trans-aconitate methyltransferase [Natribacillus halophilus]
MTEQQQVAAKIWDPTLYDNTAQYVLHYGEDVLKWLAAKEGEHIIDLGCGTGQLTSRIAESGAKVTGIDHSKAMIEEAKKQFPAMTFIEADGTDFQVDTPVDAVFSNAALHWMTDPQSVIASVSKALKPGGRFVGEMGAKENIATIIAAINMAFVEIGQEPMPDIFPWYFPSLAEYATLLEKNGFTVEQAAQFQRPTPLNNGPEGLKSWMKNFADPLLDPLSEEDREFVLERTITFAEPALVDDDTWFADYVRLRFVAVKED